jgi:H+/Cl- antiporter ClcA
VHRDKSSCTKKHCCAPSADKYLISNKISIKPTNKYPKKLLHSLGDNAQRFIPQAYPALKMDEMKRDFAVVGCACGVAGAFLTPIGGVLFAMEEGNKYIYALMFNRKRNQPNLTIIFTDCYFLYLFSPGASFWNTTLAWRSFASACVTTILFYFLNWAKSMVKAIY